jgi:hypothetical protein
MQSTDLFADQLGRLKSSLGVEEDQAAAEALGMSKAALSARKSRASFPEKELRALAQRRPELGIDVPYVLTGRRAPVGNGYATAEPGPAGNLSLAGLGLVKGWRQLDAKGREAVMGMIEALTQGAPSQVFNGPVENLAGRDVKHVTTRKVKQGKGGRIG